MNRLSLSSSTIKAIGYDARINTMEIEFQDGEIRQYHDVPIQVFQQFLTASSHGSYFNSHIKNKYRYSRA